MKVTDMHRNTVSFPRWMKGVDRVIGVKAAGLGHLDLPDVPWHDYYDDELIPQEAVALAALDWWNGDMPFVEDVFGSLIDQYA